MDRRADAEMDVKRWENPEFTYAYHAYRFIEEAYANAVSLKTCYDSLNASQQSFLTDFVKN